MKVTVCFGSTKVVVPVGDGRGLFVKDLIDAAVVRYRKATNKPADFRVRVRSLRLASEGGGILDPDDRLLAVVEDKEQIVAIYDEQEPSVSVSHSQHFRDAKVEATGANKFSVNVAKTNGHQQHHQSQYGENGPATPTNGEGRLYSQTSTPPFIPARFRASKEKGQSPAQQQQQHNQQQQIPYIVVGQGRDRTRLEAEKNSVIVDGNDSTASSSTSNLLVVRRGSEPILNEPNHYEENGSNTIDRKKRTGRRVDFVETEQRSDADDETPTGLPNRFTRSAARKSKLTDEWLEVAAIAAEDYRAKRIDDQRKEELAFETLLLRINLSTEKDCQIDVSPEFSSIKTGESKMCWLIVRGLPSVKGQKREDIGQLRIGDHIVEIDGKRVSNMALEEAKNLLRFRAGRNSPLTLLVRRNPPVSAHQETSADGENSPAISSPSLPSQPISASSNVSSNASKPQSSSTPSAPVVALQKGNTRRIGKRLSVELYKKPAPDGFGFTLTSRDNEFTDDDGEQTLVYVKTILARGAADGRLRPGDRLLEVNGRVVDGNFGQTEAVRLLRQLKEGETVSLLVSRQGNEEENAQEELDTVVQKTRSPELPRPLPVTDYETSPVLEGRTSENDGKFRRQLLIFDIHLNDTGSAGLGVSVKGRMAPISKADAEGQPRRDGGIFVKSILHGGAVHKDGRLRVNDQVIGVDNVDLRGLPNTEAMERLRTVLTDLKPAAGSVRLTVLRLMKPYVDAVSGKHSLVVGEATTNGGRPYVTFGDDEYAMIVKRPTPLGTGPWPNSEDDEPPVMIDWETVSGSRLRVSRSDSTGSSWTTERAKRQEEDDDATFVRDAPNRRSMSEKRHGAGGKIDPATTSTFQRIQHQRQTSAPSLQRRTVGSTTSSSSWRKPDKSEANSTNRPQATSSALAERRSMSLESLSKHQPAMGDANEKPLLHEQIAQSLNQKPSSPSKSAGGGVKWLKSKSAAGRQRPTNESFRQAVDRSYLGDTVDIGVDADADYQTKNGMVHSTTMDPSTAINRSRPVNKEKDRRKSTGSGLSLKNLFRFGSGGRANRPFAVVSPVSNGPASVIDDGDAPRKIEDNERHQLEAQKRAKILAEDEQRRIRQHYERMKEQQKMQQKEHKSNVVSYVSNRNLNVPSQNGDVYYSSTVTVNQYPQPPHWKPPLPPSPGKSRHHQQPHESHATNVQHGRQHSLGAENGGSPAKYGMYERAQQQQPPPRYSERLFHQPPPPQWPPAQQQISVYDPSPNGYYDSHYYVGPAEIAYGNVVRDNAHMTNGRRVNEERSAADEKRSTTTSPPSSSSWFVNGVGGSSSVRHHRFYYSSADGRLSGRSMAAQTTEKLMYIQQQECQQQQQQQQRVVTTGDSPVDRSQRARCTSELVNKSPEENRCTSSEARKNQRPPQLRSSPIEDGTRSTCTQNRDHRRTTDDDYGNRADRRRPFSPQETAESTRTSSRSADRRGIIDSIPISDHGRHQQQRRSGDGVTRIVVGVERQNNFQHQQPPPVPPPDYEQYLRKKSSSSDNKTILISPPSNATSKNGGGANVSNFRPRSEYDAVRYETASLPKKMYARRSPPEGRADVDEIMATPPARDVHFFYQRSPDEEYAPNSKGGHSNGGVRKLIFPK